MSKSRNVTGGGIALALALATLGFGSGRAFAADYLRGAYAGEQEPRAATGPDWAGVYGGIHAGYTAAQVNASAQGGALANNALPNTVITSTVASMVSLREVKKMGTSYGGFVGVNWLWDDVVLGVEADYTRSSINASASASQSRTFRPAATTDEYDITVNSNSRSRLTDWGTIRGRVGYAAGYFMPFVTAGLAIANVESRSTATGTWTRYDVSAPPARTFVSNGLINGVVNFRGVTYGAALGAGVDMQFLPNTFVRAEWQYILLASGGSRPEIAINAARVAGGVKF